jgi:lysophospholipase L1-like esterase
MYHQASPGYSVRTMLSLYSDDPPPNPNMPSRSPFMFKDGSGPAKLDMKRYLTTTLGGKVPDVILLNVGDNDTFGLNPAEVASAPEKQFVIDINTFLNHLREIAPNAIIGAAMPNSYNYSEQSFIHNYGAAYPRWRLIQNRQRYIELMHDVVKSRKDVQIIASNFVVDSIEGMPYNSGTHFNNAGARQFAGSVYAWLKVQLASKPLAATGVAAVAPAVPVAATPVTPPVAASTAPVAAAPAPTAAAVPPVAAATPAPPPPASPPEKKKEGFFSRIFGGK